MSSQDPNALQAKELDIARTVETTLFGLLRLIASVVRTFIYFTFRPSRFRPYYMVSEPTRRSAHEFTRPLTYLVTATILLFGIFATLILSFEEYDLDDEELPRVIRWFSDFLNGDVNLLRVVLMSLPVVLVVGLFALATKLACAWLRNPVEFDVSLSLCAYWVGSTSIAYAIAVSIGAHVFDPNETATMTAPTTYYMAIAGGLFYAVLLAAIRSYLLLLRRQVGATRWRIAGVYVVSNIIFSCLAFVIGYWIHPVVLKIFPDLGDMF